jgi:TPR repeat protein
LIVAVLALAGFGAFIAYQWRQFPNWRTALSSLQSKPLSAQSRQIGGTPAQQQAEPAKAHQEAATQQPATSDSPLAATQSPPLAAQPSSNSTEVHSTSARRDQVPQSDLAPRAKSDSPRVTPSRNDTDVLLTRGLAHLYGNGTQQSCEQALVFLNSAARKGNAKAISQLGGLYATGHCVPLDRARAYQYFTRAREAGGGNVYVERNRSMLWNQMSDAERARVRGAE